MVWLAIAVGLAAGPARAASPATPDSSILTIAGPREPGTKLIVTGHVLTRDGKRPVPGARVGVYHADASGTYGARGGMARLSGWLLTDAAGRFEIRTVRPGAYLGPSHIHFIVGGFGTYELRFADERLSRMGRQSPVAGTGVQVRPVRKDAKGVHHVAIDWRLQ